MDPIISPWIIYIIGVFDITNGIAATLLGATSVLLIMSTVYYFDHDKNDSCKKFIKRLFTCSCILLLLIIFVPREEISYKMLTVNYITIDNINSTGETIDAILDKIVEKILKIKNG